MPIHILRTILNECLGEQNIKFNFLINCYKFSQSDVEHICGINDNVITNFIITLRPDTICRQEVINYLNYIDIYSNFEIYIKCILPNMSCWEFNKINDIHTPVIRKLFVEKEIDIGTCSENDLFKLINENTYFSNIYDEVKEYPNDYSLLFYALLLCYGGINTYQIDTIKKLLKNSYYEDIHKEVLNDDIIIWKLQNKFRIVSGWREYLFYRHNIKNLKYQIENFFCFLYKKIYNQTIKKSSYIVIEYADLECLTVSNYFLWLNPKFTEYYNELLRYSMRLLKHDKRYFENAYCLYLNEFADFLINNDFFYSIELCQISIFVFELTQKLDLLLTNLERIKEYLNEQVDSHIMDSNYVILLVENIIEFLSVAICYGDKWCDITIVGEALVICEFLLSKKVCVEKINVLLGTLKSKNCSRNLSKETINELLVNNCCLMLYDKINEEENVSMEIDVLIMIATLEEEEAILKNDYWEKHETESKYVYFTKTENGVKFALTRGISMGETDASIMAQFFIGEFKPKAIAMAGFCAGAKGKVNLGDVVIPYKVYDYEGGKQTGENIVLPEINSFTINDKWKQAVERFGDEWRKKLNVKVPKDFESQCNKLLILLYNNGGRLDISKINKEADFPNWTYVIKHLKEIKHIYYSNNTQVCISKIGRNRVNNFLIEYPDGIKVPSPKTTLGVLATGKNVQQWDGIFEFLQNKHDRKTNVLDMEGYAIGKLASFNEIPYIIAKGVGDFARNGKAFDNRFIEYACHASCRFIIEFFTQYKTMCNI